MQKEKNYKTVEGRDSAEIIEKKSRFIATVCPIANEEDALAFIDEMRKKYYNASHNVFAYRLRHMDIQRMSDDGEPSGTAGMPVLDVLRGNEVCDAAIVVTRYFGGTLLGTGGLVRAYSGAAKQGLEAAGIVEMIMFAEYEIESDYQMSGKVQYELLNMGVNITDTVYTHNVTFYCLVRLELTEMFEKEIVNISNGRITPKSLSKGYKKGAIVLPR